MVLYTVPAFISTEQPITHCQLPVGLYSLWSLHHNLYAIHVYLPLEGNNG